MKLSIERATLLKAVSHAQSVVERRNTIPILANVLIEAEGADVRFRATDLDIEVVDKVEAMVERAGATTVSATTLHEIVRKLPDGAQVTLTDDGASGRLTVEAGRSNSVSSERSRAVKLALDEDRLVLSVNAPDSGAAEEELAVAYGDERLEIGFNAKYLLEIASQVDRENAVFLFNSSGDPTLMREGNDTSAVYVVMPMRV